MKGVIRVKHSNRKVVLNMVKIFTKRLLRINLNFSVLWMRTSTRIIFIGLLAINRPTKLMKISSVKALVIQEITNQQFSIMNSRFWQEMETLMNKIYTDSKKKINVCRNISIRTFRLTKAVIRIKEIIRLEEIDKRIKIEVRHVRRLKNLVSS